MPFLEGLSMPLIVGIVSTMGAPGLVLILWYVDHRKMDRIISGHQVETQKTFAAHQKETNAILAAYKEDMNAMSRMYENNVDLVRHYETLAGDLSGVIHLNTQVQTQLVEHIKHNMFCPIVREKGPG